MQKNPLCKMMQRGTENLLFTASSIRTIPLALESHQISGAEAPVAGFLHLTDYRQWGISPRPEDSILLQ